MLTAKTMLDARIQGLQLGADDYMGKPFSADELLVRSQNLIDKQRKLIQKTLTSPGEIETDSRNEVLVKQIVQIIEEHMSDYNLSVDLIAKEMGISKSTIQRKLKGTINKNLNQLIREYRLEKARKMIEKKPAVFPISQKQPVSTAFPIFLIPTKNSSAKHLRRKFVNQY